MANTSIGKGRSPTPLRTVSTIRREIRDLEDRLQESYAFLEIEYRIIGSCYEDLINAKKSTINFLTTRIRRRKFYNWLRKKTGCK